MRRKTLRTHDRRLITLKTRNFGTSAAHLVYPVPLLPSGPGGVRGTSLHRARSSTVRQSRCASAMQSLTHRPNALHFPRGPATRVYALWFVFAAFFSAGGASQVSPVRKHWELKEQEPRAP